MNPFEDPPPDPIREALRPLVVEVVREELLRVLGPEPQSAYDRIDWYGDPEDESHAHLSVKVALESIIDRIVPDPPRRPGRPDPRPTRNEVRAAHQATASDPPDDVWHMAEDILDRAEKYGVRDA